MRSIAVVIIISFLGLNSYSQSEEGTEKVKWHSIQEAVELSKKNPKKLFIDVYTDWCGWCIKMDKNTFSHPVIAEYLNTHFYPVKLNAETKDTIFFGNDTLVNKNPGGRGSSHQFAVALLQGRMSYPSIAYIDQNMTPLGAVPGYKTPAGIEPWLHYVDKEIYKTTKWEDFIATFVGEIKE